MNAPKKLTIKEFCMIGAFELEEKIEDCEICIVDGYTAFPYKVLNSSSIL